MREANEKKNCLSFIPGALDILQALTRRAVLPIRSTKICAVPGCGATPTATHVFLTNDPAHRQFFANDLRAVFPSTPTLPSILKSFAKKEPNALRYVSERLLRHEVKDAMLQKWCRRVLRSLALMPQPRA